MNLHYYAADRDETKFSAGVHVQYSYNPSPLMPYNFTIFIGQAINGIGEDLLLLDIRAL